MLLIVVSSYNGNAVFNIDHLPTTTLNMSNLKSITFPFDTTIRDLNNYFSSCGWPEILPRRSQSCPIINSPRSTGGTKSEPPRKRPDEYSVAK